LNILPPFTPKFLWFRSGQKCALSPSQSVTSTECSGYENCLDTEAEANIPLVAGAKRALVNADVQTSSVAEGRVNSRFFWSLTSPDAKAFVGIESTSSPVKRLCNLPFSKSRGLNNEHQTHLTGASILAPLNEGETKNFTSISLALPKLFSFLRQLRKSALTIRVKFLS
jgi:hypothetical protein